MGKFWGKRMAEKINGKASPATILFGEYLAELGGSVIAFPAQEYVEVRVEKKKELEDIEIDNQITKEKFLKNEKKDAIESKIFDCVFGNELDVPKKGFKIIVCGNATTKTCGYLFALSAAFEKAVNQLSITSWKSDNLFENIHKAEEVVGKDELKAHSACAAYNSFVLIEEGKTESKPRTLKAAKALFFVLAKTNPKTSAEEMKTKLLEKFKKNDKHVLNAISDVKKIVSKSKNEFKFGGNAEIGKLMTQNQTILSDLGLSWNEADQIIKIVTYEGALGAKITGYEGNVLILCEGDKQQEKVLASLIGKGFNAIKIKVS